MARDLVKELKPIRVNVVAPGYIETDMIKDWSEEKRKFVISKTPLGRLGKPEDVAEVVYCLVEKFRYINGEVIHVNGGFYLH